MRNGTAKIAPTRLLWAVAVTQPVSRHSDDDISTDETLRNFRSTRHLARQTLISGYLLLRQRRRRSKRGPASFRRLAIADHVIMSRDATDDGRSAVCIGSQQRGPQQSAELLPPIQLSAAMAMPQCALPNATLVQPIVPVSNGAL